MSHFHIILRSIEKNLIGELLYQEIKVVINGPL